MATAPRFSLRERKFARTRLALAEVVTNHLENAPLEALSVRALCERAQISEATFFNYFPKKEAIVVYLEETLVAGVALVWPAGGKPAEGPAGHRSPVSLHRDPDPEKAGTDGRDHRV